MKGYHMCGSRCEVSRFRQLLLWVPGGVSAFSCPPFLHSTAHGVVAILHQNLDFFCAFVWGFSMVRGSTIISLILKSSSARKVNIAFCNLQMKRLSREVKSCSLITDRDKKHGNNTDGQKFQASGRVQAHLANSPQG